METSPIKGKIVSGKLDKILITPSQRDYDERVKKLIEKKTPGGRFAGYDSEDSLAVRDIIKAVYKDGDKALAKFTEKFDGVKLKPNEFLVKKIWKKPIRKLTQLF